jgi:hypothetical protein
MMPCARRSQFDTRAPSTGIQQLENVMTRRQAAELRMKWNQQGNSPPCAHSRLELERSDNGYLTGHYICIVCGEAVTQPRT